jgi:hypothetical protein
MTMRARFYCCLLACAAVLPAVAGDDPLSDLKKGQPRDVAALIDRLAGCNHFSGEEAYDVERRKEIAAAMADLRCSRLDADEARARKRYASKRPVLDALKRARRMSY